MEQEYLDPEVELINSTFINSGQKIACSFLFPNGMIVTFDKSGNQIPMLQGKYSVELHDKIISYSDHNTDWKGPFAKAKKLEKLNKHIKG